MARRKIIVFIFYNSYFDFGGTKPERLVEYSIVDKETNKGDYGALIGRWFLKRLTKRAILSNWFLTSLYPSKPDRHPHKHLSRRSGDRICRYEVIGNINNLIKEINKIFQINKNWKRVKLS